MIDSEKTGFVITDTLSTKKEKPEIKTTPSVAPVVSIYTLADAFLSIESMTQKKLQKLCYYAKAWYLALYNENIIQEQFQAWVHGAVNPQLFHKYHSYGFEKIPKRKNNDDIPESVMSFALDVYDAYGQYTGDQLEYINHKEDPWINARKGLNPWEACSNVISENDMKEYYRTKVSNDT